MSVDRDFDKLKHLNQIISLVASAANKELPIRAEPKWTPEMGKRLHRARKWQCQKVDRRSSDWRHKESNPMAFECRCLSQEAAARQLGVSQSTLSKIENGVFSEGHIEIAALWSVFGDALIYILTGWERVKYEGFPQRYPRIAR